MRDTDIYDGRHRSPDPPPKAAAGTGSKHATPRVKRPDPTVHAGGETT